MIAQCCNIEFPLQDTNLNASNALSAVKSLLQKAQPHLLAKLSKITVKEDVLSVVINLSEGLTCKKLNAEEINVRTQFMSLDNIDQLSLKIFSKVMM